MALANTCELHSKQNRAHLVCLLVLSFFISTYYVLFQKELKAQVEETIHKHIGQERQVALSESSAERFSIRGAWHQTRVSPRNRSQT